MKGKLHFFFIEIENYSSHCLDYILQHLLLVFQQAIAWSYSFFFFLHLTTVELSGRAKRQMELFFVCFKRLVCICIVFFLALISSQHFSNLLAKKKKYVLFLLNDVLNAQIQSKIQDGAFDGKPQSQ